MSARLITLLAATATTLLIAVVDHVTRVDVALTLLYLVPIAVGTWRGGFRIGVWLASLATASSVADEVLGRRPILVTAWNALGLLVLFLSLAYLLDRHRERLEQERQEHRLTVDQLRHADRLSIIGTLTAGVAHELGTPLNVISGSAELIVHARDPHEIEEMSGVIRGQAERIGGLVRHLLEFGRRAGTDAMTVVDLNQLARSSATLLASIATKRSVEVAVEPTAAPVRVRGNIAQLEQVVCNLILNAVDAMPRGGTVTIAIRVGAITEHEPGRGTLTVEDHGAGIAPADLPHIFEPFFTTKGVGEGTGLGLSVSHGIVRDLGGAITVDSAPGQGARFTVALPLVDDRPPSEVRSS